jgi:hypothetical protein
MSYGPDLVGRANCGWCRRGQDLPRSGAGPRPAGCECWLRQAGGSAPGRWGSGPLDRKLYASGLNQALAKALDADVLLVGRWPAPDAGSGEERADRAPSPGLDPTAGTAQGLAEALAIAASGYWSGEQARVIGCAVNGLPAEDPSPAAQLGEALAQRGLRLIAAVLHLPELTWLRVRDLVCELGPRVLNEGDLSRRIKDVAVFAQGVPGGLRVLTEGRLVVVPGDRHEVVMAACLAAHNGTRLAALLLAVGIEPDPRIWELTRASWATGLPILVLEDNSYETATRVRDLDPGLPIDDLERIEGVTESIADALDASWLESLLSSSRSRAPSEASPAACCWDRPTWWPDWPTASGCSCLTASPWSIPTPSPSATSPRWPSCGGTAAGPKRWHASISPTQSCSPP